MFDAAVGGQNANRLINNIHDPAHAEFLHFTKNLDEKREWLHADYANLEDVSLICVSTKVRRKLLPFAGNGTLQTPCQCHSSASLQTPPGESWIGVCVDILNSSIHPRIAQSGVGAWKMPLCLCVYPNAIRSVPYCSSENNAMLGRRCRKQRWDQMSARIVARRALAIVHYSRIHGLTLTIVHQSFRSMHY